MKEFEILSNNVCDQCKKIGSDLITPCDNIECTNFSRQECINELIIKWKNKCDNPIVATKTKKINPKIYCNKILMILITSVLFIICAATPGLLIFGTSIFDKIFVIKNLHNGWVIVSTIAIVVAIIFDFIIIFYLCFGFYFDDYYYIKISEFTGIENKRCLIIKYFLLFIIYFTILIYHFLGFLILKFVLDIKKHF